MTDLPLTPSGFGWPRARLATRVNRLISSPRFQAWAAGFPFIRRLVRREGEGLFDLVAGFCHSQVLMAIVELRLPETLVDGPRPLADLGREARVAPDRMRVLVRAGVALGLLKLSGNDQVSLTRRGAALAGVPGLREMILHHQVFYRDLSDPVAFLRGETETELAGFWPYVFGSEGQGDAQTARRYSDLMAQSQRLVAQDTLAAVSFADVDTLMDVGGGSGAFLGAVAEAHPGLRGILFDLPAVVPAARDRFAAAGLSNRMTVVPGSFREDRLPSGADAVSLVRVLYDHRDETVLDLLRSVHAALPVGGRLIVSEPMTGGARPERAGDCYFALYTMAMRTGRARSAAEIAGLCGAAGFSSIVLPKPRRPFVTSVVVARKS